MQEIGLSKWQRFWNNVLLAVMISVATISLLVLVTLAWRSFFSAPPLEAKILDEPNTVLCPGQRFDAHIETHIKRPVLLYIYSSVMNEGRNYNLQNSQASFGPMPHPLETYLVMSLEWTVPELPSGNYVRLITIRGYSTSESPIFLETPIQIGENCGKPNPDN